MRRYNGVQDIQYQWNSLGQLTGVYTPGTGWVQYGYNGFGRRARRTAGGVTTRYVYDGDDLAAEVDASGNRIRTYAFWPGIDQPYSMRTWENGANGALHYYALDLPSNNVIGLFNTAGTATHAYHYSPYGEAQSSSEPTHNPLRFAARELDAKTGLYYVRARWYDPFLGRFISEDPIGLAGGINQYAYALNDPVNLSDPSGLQPCPPGRCKDNPYQLGTVTVVAPRHWYTSIIDQAISLGGGEGRGTSIFGAGMVLGGSWNDDGSGPGQVEDSFGEEDSQGQCPNTTPRERELARRADRRSSVSGTEEGYFVGPLGFYTQIGGRGVTKGAGFIRATPPFWATTQIHNHPSGGGISVQDSVYAYRYDIRVVTGSARTNRFGAIDPGGARSTCVTTN